MELDDVIDLPRTAAAWERGASYLELAPVAQEELQGLAASLVEEACGSEGGGSDDEEVELRDLALGQDELRLSVTVTYALVTPSGCSDHPRREHREARREIMLQSDSSIGIVGVANSDPVAWDLEDRNSAADGT